MPETTHTDVDPSTGDVDVVVVHRLAVMYFDTIVASLTPTVLTSPSPCAEWDVRTLVNHVVYEGLWTPPMLAGQTIAEVGDRFDGDVLGTNPLTAWRGARDAALDAASADGATTTTTHLSFGDTPGAQYLWQLAADHLVHGWDLARALGVNETMPPKLVDAISAWFAPMETTYRAAGAIGTRPTVAADADEQTILLAAFGRDAR